MRYDTERVAAEAKAGRDAGDKTVRTPYLATVDCALRSYDLSDHEGLANAREAFKTGLAGLLDQGLIAPGAPRHAYVTFATPDYEWGLLVWLRSLRKVSSVPVVVMAPMPIPIPDDIADVGVLVVPGLGNRRVSADRGEFRFTFSKLWIFAMTPLARLVFVDVDCLFLKSLDHLFDSSDIQVAPDYVENRRTDQFNSGMIALTPTFTLEEEIFARAAEAHTYDGGDQGTLNTLILNRVRFVPESTNLLRHYYYFSGRHGVEDVRLIHYIVKKPWELTYRETPDAFLVELDDLWTSHLHHDELLRLVAYWRREVFFKSERAKIESIRRWGPHDLDNRLGLLEHRMNRIVGAFKLGKRAVPLAMAAFAALVAVVALVALVRAFF